MKVVLYTIDCPMCKVLEKNLDEKGFRYEKNTNKDNMRELGITHCPMLLVDNKLLNFKEAMQYIKEN